MAVIKVQSSITWLEVGNSDNLRRLCAIIYRAKRAFSVFYDFLPMSFMLILGRKSCIQFSPLVHGNGYMVRFKFSVKHPVFGQYRMKNVHQQFFFLKKASNDHNLV